MKDPRLDEVLERTKEVGTDGKPSVAAQFALKVEAYLADIESLRKDLNAATAEVSELETRLASMNSTIMERDGIRQDLVYEAQDLSVRSAMSGFAGDSGGLKRLVEEKRSMISDFDKSHESEVARFERVRASLTAKRALIKKNRDLIALRMNTVASLVDRASREPVPASGVRPVVPAEVRTPAASSPSGTVAAASANSTGTKAAVARPQRMRRVRIIRRR